MIIPLNVNISQIIRNFLAEDIGSGDVTTQTLVPEALRARMRLVAKEPMVMAGADVAAQVFYALDTDADIYILVKDSDRAEAATALMEIEGSARALLTAERVALNLLQRMCGVASLTRRYVDAVAGTHAKILDTRKTMPGLRALDKYAVTCGGGVNHRFGLYDAIMIKDNHVALCGGIIPAMEKARGASVPVILECDTLDQVREALTAKPDRILLDNMNAAMLKEAVALTAGRIPLEASGGVSLETVRSIAETGVNFISVGAITHSARAMDIGADININ